MGCGLIWLGVVLLILSGWLPWLGSLIVPAFVLFLALQIFRWMVPASDAEKKSSPERQ